MGLGHLSRLLSVAQELRKSGAAEPEFLIFGEYIEKNELAGFNTVFIPLLNDFVEAIKDRVQIGLAPSVVIFDLYPKHEIVGVKKMLLWIKSRNIHLVGVESFFEYCDLLDVAWVSSFSFDSSMYSDSTDRVKFGWDSYLIQKRLPSQEWTKGKRILILTGGGDVTHLGNSLPTLLDGSLDKNTEVHWVRGPFAGAPSLPDKTRLNWRVHYAPTQLDELIVESNYVLTVFGVSFFEVLQYGIPSVVFSPYGDKDSQELKALSDEKVAMVAENDMNAVAQVVALMKNDHLAKALSEKALENLSINGARRLSDAILSLEKV